MAETLPRHMIMGFIIFTIFISGGVYLIGILSEDNPTMVNDSRYTLFNSSFNQLSAVSDEVGTLEAGINSTNATGYGAFGVLNSLISSSWYSIRMIGQSWAFMGIAMEGISTVFGVPDWIPPAIFMLITVVFMFSILSAIFQREL